LKFEKKKKKLAVLPILYQLNWKFDVFLRFLTSKVRHTTFLKHNSKVMNPLLKRCLIDSHRSAQTPSADVSKTPSTDVSQTPSNDVSDPYFDENQRKSSTHSTDSSLFNSSVRSPSLGNNIMRNHKNRDPYDIFEPAKLLGSGSMVCSNKS
jgi:hypothetical protein